MNDDRLPMLEPDALAERPDDDGRIRLSVAISLKRIADGLWGTDDTTGLLQLLNPLDIRNHF